jgi:nucleoid-associated protein YgaU
MRYQSTDTIQDEARGRVQETTRYPTADELTQGATTTIRTESGDRLDLLAQEYYGDTSLWWVIARANKLDGDSWILEPGQQLQIPRSAGLALDKLREANR